MTDNEIIKALECCNSDGDCSNCPYERARFVDELECTEELHADALVLIKRQKAEIEEQHQAILNALKRMGEIRTEAVKATEERLQAYKLHYSNIRNEAVKEFADRLKAKARINEWNGTICGNDIDNLLKEMENEDGKLD